MSSSGFHSELEAAPHAPSRKKRKTTHISADKALVLRADIQPHNDAGPSSLLRTTRQRKEVNYARIKHKYTKK